MAQFPQTTGAFNYCSRFRVSKQEGLQRFKFIVIQVIIPLTLKWR